MYRSKALDGLYVDDNLALDRQVNAIADLKLVAFIDHREERRLRQDFEAALALLKRKAGVVSAFK